MSKKKSVGQKSIEEINNLPYFSSKSIENSPFTIIERTDDNDKQVATIVMGSQVACDKVFKSTKEAEDYINSKPWDLILVGAVIYLEKVVEQKQKLENYEG